MPDVFLPGNLVRIKGYQFEDGTQRDKYLFVLLRNDATAYVISSLTTSQNKMNVSAAQSGCYLDSRISTYYHFPAGEVIGTGDFAFDKETYIFFRDNVRKLAVNDLSLYASIKDPFAVAHVATLSKEGLKKLLQCAITSKFTPTGLKTEMQDLRTCFDLCKMPNSRT